MIFGLDFLQQDVQERVTRTDEQKTQGDYLSKLKVITAALAMQPETHDTPADNDVCLERTLGEPVDLVSDFYQLAGMQHCVRCLSGTQSTSYLPAERQQSAGSVESRPVGG